MTFTGSKFPADQILKMNDTKLCWYFQILNRL